MIIRVITLSIALLLSTDTVAGTITLTSPVERVTVVELYTSHGCSSCPPADRWLRGLVDNPALWSRVIPLSFHVDYWDRLGWPDRFARKAFSQRQQAYQRSGGIRTVYTPGVVLNGREWRGWYLQPAPEFDYGAPVGRLQLTVEPGSSAALSFMPLVEHGQFSAHIAVLGFGLTSVIGGGENAGRTLREDFVVLGVSNGAVSEAMEQMRWRLPWPTTPDVASSRHAVVAWVSAADSPAPLQAVGGWLP